MKAITYHRYGGPEVLQIEELEKPTPSAHEILIKSHVTTVTSGDWRIRSLSMPPGLGLVARLMFGITKPRQPILGSELAGVIAEVGSKVTRFKAGDRVVVFTGAKLGCSAEFICVAEDANIVLIPDQLSFSDAAALPFGGTTAIDFFRKGELRSCDKVLINGASGCVGVMAVQFAKHHGAHVTGVCSGKNIDLVKSLGADEVIDYTQQDFTDSGNEYDIIMDTAATAPFHRSSSCLTSNGRYLVVNGGVMELLRAPFINLTSKRRVVAGPAAERLDDLREIVEMASRNELRAVIDNTYPFDEFIKAHERVDSGRKTGSVVLIWE